MRGRAGKATGGSMAVIKWRAPISGTWSVGANWSGGLVPGLSDDAVIGGLGASQSYTISVTAAAGFQGHSITLNDRFATLAFASGLSCAVPVTLQAGQITGPFPGTAPSIAQLTASGGTIANVSVGTLSVAGSIAFAGNVSVGSLSLAGPGGTGTASVILSNPLSFGIGTSLAVGGTLDMANIAGTGYISWGGPGIAGIGSHAIISAQGGVSLHAGSGTLSNAGSLLADGTAAQMEIYALAGSNAGLIRASGRGSVLIATGGFTNTGSVLASSGGSLSIDNLASNSGMISCTGAGSVLSLGLNSANPFGAIGVSAGGVLTVTGYGTNTILLSGGTQLTLGLGGSISNAGGTVILSGHVTNAGTITDATPYIFNNGAEIDGGSVTDATGSLRFGALSDVAFSGTLVAAPAGKAINQLVSLSGTTLLSGASAGSGAAIFLNSGGAISFQDAAAAAAGSVFSASDNTTLNLGSSWSGAGSTLSVQGSATTLTFGSNLLALACDVTANGTLMVRSSAGSASQLTLASTMTIAGRASIIAALPVLTGAWRISGTGAALYAGPPLLPGTLTLASTAVITASAGGTAYLGGYRIVGGGSISATGAGSAVAGFFNRYNGTVSISSGGTLILPGIYRVTGVNQLPLPRNFVNDGGVVSLQGTISNTGTILTSTSLTGKAATVIGGTLIDPTGGFFADGGEARNVTILGNETVTAGFLYLGGTTTLSGASGGAMTLSVTGTSSSLTMDQFSSSLTMDQVSFSAGSTIAISNGARLIAPHAPASGPFARGAIAIKLGPAALFSITQNCNLGAAATLHESAIGTAYIAADFAPTTLSNAGIIVADTAGGTLALNAQVSRFVEQLQFFNSGLIAAVNGGDIIAGLRIRTSFTGLTNTGALAAVGSGSLLDLSSATLANSNAGTLRGGIYVASGGGRMLLGGAAVTTLAADLRLTDGASSITAGTTTLGLDASITTIAAGGALRESGARNVSNANSLSVAGLLQLAGSTYHGAALGISTGGEVSGFGTLGWAVSDNGLLDAQGGTFLLEGSVSGSGQLAIGKSATLDLGGAVANGMVVNFTGANASLRLDSASAFGGVIAGFAAGDRIDIANTAIAAVSSAGTLITYTDQAGHAHMLQLTSALSGGTLSLSADGTGGTFITAGPGVVAAAMALPVLNDMASAALGPLSANPLPAAGRIAGGAPHGKGFDAAPAIGPHPPGTPDAAGLHHLGPLHPF